MTLAGLLDVLVADPALAAARDAAAGDAPRPFLDLTGPPSLRPFVVAGLAAAAPRGAGRPVLAVTATGREAEDLVTQLRSFLPEHAVADFPAWETLPHERLSPRADTVGRRLAVLRRLAHPSPEDAAAGPLQVVVAPVRSMLQPLVGGLGDLEPVTVQVGDEVSLDVFPPAEEHPIRLELWGDTVEELRQFAVSDQRSLGPASRGLWAPPCRELLLTGEVRARAKALAADHPGLVDILDRIADGIPVEGMEALAPVLSDEMELLVEQLPRGTHVVVCDPERVRARSAELVRTSQEFLDASWAAAAESGGQAPLDLGAAAYRSLAEVRETAVEHGLPWWGLSPFSTDEDTSTGRAPIGRVAPSEMSSSVENGDNPHHGNPCSTAVSRTSARLR